MLHDITLSLRAGEKLAVYGRMGSGESSLLLSILGMVNQSSGNIVRDGVYLPSVPTDTTCRKITCVTQDLSLFSGSVRLNSDHLGDSTDVEDVVAAMEKVGLWGWQSRGDAQ